MIDSIIHNGPFIGAFSGTFGLLAQLSLPEDFGSWPVTAMLCLVIIICLSIIYKMSKANTDNSIAATKALTDLANGQKASNDNIDKLVTAVYESAKSTDRLITTIENRPCISQR